MVIVKIPTHREEFKAYYALRYRVLREPVGQPKGTEKDDYEPISYHFMAVDELSGEVLGVVKIFERAPSVGQFSHLAVLENHQREGIGKLLLQTVEQKARELNFKTIGTMTRLTATSFYEKFNYKIGGFTKMSPGKQQLIWMEKDLN